ncbi:copper chaperone [Spirosoma foliorum]|uniref:DUF2182 domain-containing protein n=1 Tax=Spirosoma foliorum TaxID=2710596 RepID=A0A7G5H2T7_9BACT|nr:DUF2182 domain-containing protein [Spirosoma foliorum]QMW05429.1 DUF2182 domain-containing protein [Spirosoma foliorum]
MKLSWKNRITINLVIISISLFVWVLLLINPGHIMTIEHCHVSTSGPSTASLQMLLEMNPFSSQLIGWGIMVVAMMLPKLIVPIQYICIQNFKENRLLTSLLFVFGYVSAWMLVGVFMVGAIISLNLLLPMSYIPALGVFFIAVIWQFSPIKQRCLNQGHDHRRLAVFGWPAYRDAFLFGLMHGTWCVGSGWALMLWPMLLPNGHNLAMIMVTFIMLSEHLEHPQIPRWRIDFRTKLLRILVAQTQIKLKQVQGTI